VRTGYIEGRNRIDSFISDIYDWGASALTIHGRSRQQRYSKLADWDYIYGCVGKAPNTFQVLGNGDVFSYLDWNKHLSDCPELSSCMIARGALIKVLEPICSLFFHLSYVLIGDAVFNCKLNIAFCILHYSHGYSLKSRNSGIGTSVLVNGWIF